MGSPIKPKQNPFDSILKNVVEEPQARTQEPGRINPFNSIVGIEDGEEDTGFFGSLETLGRNYLEFFNSPIKKFQDEKKALVGEKTTFEILRERASGFLNFLGQLPTSTSPVAVQASPVVQQFGATVSEAVEGFAGAESFGAAVGMFAKGLFIQPVIDLQRSTTGLSFGEEQLRVLRPEERADAIEATTAFVAATVATIGTTRLLQGTLAGGKVGVSAKAAQEAIKGLEKKTTRELLKTAAKLPTISPVKRQVISGSVGGAVGGATFGAIEGAGDEDQAAKMFAFAALFAPLGIALEAVSARVFGANSGPELIAQKASELARLRNLRSIDNAVIERSITNIEFLSKTGDTGIALALTKEALDPDGQLIISGVEVPETLTKIVQGKRDPIDIPTVVRHERTDGLSDLLIVGKDNPLATDAKSLKFFETHGVVDGEVVSYGGRDVIVNSASKGILEVRDFHVGGELFDVPRDAITRKSSLELAKASPGASIAEFSAPSVARQITDDFAGFIEQNLSKEARASARRLKALENKSQRRPLSREEASELVELRNLKGEGEDFIIKDLTERIKAIEDPNSFEAAFLAEELANLQGKDATARFLEANPDILPSFEELVNDFLSSRNIDAGNAPAAQKLLSRTLAARLRELAIPEDNAIFSRISQEIVDFRKSNVNTLEALANANGVIVDFEEGGKMVLRDFATDSKLGAFTREDDALNFLRKAGQANGVDLDNLDFFILPSDLAGDLAVPPVGLQAYEVPATIMPPGRLEEIFAAFDASSTIPFLRPTRSNLFRAFDTLHGTTLSPQVSAIQTAKLRSNAAARPAMENLKGLESRVRGLTRERRKLLGAAIESMSPDEIKTRGARGGRAMSSDDIILAEALVTDQADIKRIFTYRRNRDRIIKRFGIDNPETAKLLSELENTLGITSNELKHATAFDEITGSVGTGPGKPRSQRDLGAVTRLARAMTPDELGQIGITQQEFFKLHKFKPDEIAVVSDLEKLYSTLGDTFGIPADSRLQSFMTHFRTYNDSGTLARSIREQGGDPKTVEFYARLARTGEIDVFERDPILAALRYIKAGFDADIVEPALQAAKKDFALQIEKVPLESQPRIQQAFNTFIEDVKHIPNLNDQAAEGMLTRVLGKLGIKLDIGIKKDIVSTVLTTGEAAAQGGRIVAGLRDFFSAAAITFSMLKGDRTASIIKLGARGLNELDVEELKRFGITLPTDKKTGRATRRSLRESGIIPGLSMLPFEDPGQAALRRFGLGSIEEGIARVGDLGLTLSGQPTVYSIFHAGAQLDVLKRGSKLLTDLEQNKISKATVWRELGLDNFEVPVQKEFDRLITAGENTQALRFLGFETGRDLINVYGLINHPEGWGTNVGRLMGQFGIYAMFLRGATQRIISRGTIAQRAGRITRLAAANAALALAGEATGFNFATWYNVPGAFLLDDDAPILPGVPFGGGPSVQTFQTVVDAFGASGIRQRMAMGELRRMLPFDPVSGRINIPHLYAPGSFLANDVFRAFELAEKGFDPFTSLARGIGIKVKGER